MCLTIKSGTGYFMYPIRYNESSKLFLGGKGFYIRDNEIGSLYMGILYKIKISEIGIELNSPLKNQSVNLYVRTHHNNDVVFSKQFPNLGMHVDLFRYDSPPPMVIFEYDHCPQMFKNIPVVGTGLQLVGDETAIFSILTIPTPEFLLKYVPDYRFQLDYKHIWEGHLKRVYESAKKNGGVK